MYSIIFSFDDDQSVSGFIVCSKVSPAEIEDVIRKLPCIKDTAVIGIPNKEYGEVPRAYIVCRSKAEPEEIVAFVTENVAQHKQLRGGIEFVNEIPRTASGKIRRSFLKEQYMESLEKDEN